MSYLATLARETSHTLEYLAWKLPYSTGLGLIHAAAIHHGQEREFVEYREGAASMSARREMRDEFQLMREKWNENPFDEVGSNYGSA